MRKDSPGDRTLSLNLLFVVYVGVLVYSSYFKKGKSGILNHAFGGNYTGLVPLAGNFNSLFVLQCYSTFVVPLSYKHETYCTIHFNIDLKLFLIWCRRFVSTHFRIKNTNLILSVQSFRCDRRLSSHSFGRVFEDLTFLRVTWRYAQTGLVCACSKS